MHSHQLSATLLKALRIVQELLKCAISKGMRRTCSYPEAKLWLRLARRGLASLKLEGELAMLQEFIRSLNTQVLKGRGATCSWPTAELWLRLARDELASLKLEGELAMLQDSLPYHLPS